MKPPIMRKICSSLIDCKEERRVLFTKKGYLIKQCRQCGHRFTEIEETKNHLSLVYSDDYFFNGKDGYPNYLDEKAILIGSGKKYAKIVSNYTKSGKILDVGCAAGFILKGFELSGWECYGVEPNDTMASYGRKELNLNISTASLENFHPDYQFDLIGLIQVIGSFYDLDKAMSNVYRLLAPGGLVLVESWDRNSIVARIFGKSWHEYCPPSVIHWYSDKTLTELFKYYGFEFIAKGRPSKIITMNHALSVFESNTPKFIFKKKLIEFLSRISGKRRVKYPPFDLKWYIFKKL